jgi:uncharacterized membrane protein
MWAVAVLTFGAGDVATTHLGLQQEGVEEAHPLSEEVLGVGGSAGMVVVKVAAFMAAYAAYNRVDEDYRVGIPLGLALLGSFIVVNNLAVIQEAVGRA